MIRPGIPGDFADVRALWQVAGSVPTTTDSDAALKQLVERDSGALLVAEKHGEIVGTLIAAWNGWRGSFYRLAVRPDHRRSGLATQLVRVGEERLRALGAHRLDAIVARGEEHAVEFGAAVGYDHQDGQYRFVRNV
jgi:ribosomal protein S18 acetylase RimI-like enzyme